MAGRALALAGAGCVGLAGWGCSETTAGPRTTMAPEDSAIAAHDAGATIVGKNEGLEVRWWMTEATGEALLAALGDELTNPVPLDDRTREMLAANGFRVVRLSAEAAERLPSLLRPVASVQEQRLAQTGVWTDVARGPVWDRARLLTMHDGPLELPAGRMRLLARGWVTPTPALAGSGGAIEPTVSFELVPQHQDRVDTRTRDVADLTLEEPDATPQGQGVMFWRLALRGQLREGEALVVLAEDPFQRWSDGDESAAAEKSETASNSASSDAASPQSTPLGRVVRGNEERPILAPAPAEPPAKGNPVGPVAGPPSLSAPTIGEALMLSRPFGPGGGSGGGRFGSRAIVVLVPRTPENFRLLGGAVGR